MCRGRCLHRSKSYRLIWPDLCGCLTLCQLIYGLKQHIKTGDNQVGPDFDHKGYNADYQQFCDLYEGMVRHPYFGPLIYAMLHEAFCDGMYVHDLLRATVLNPAQAIHRAKYSVAPASPASRVSKVLPTSP